MPYSPLLAPFLSVAEQTVYVETVLCMVDLNLGVRRWTLTVRFPVECTQKGELCLFGAELATAKGHLDDLDFRCITDR